MISMVTCKQAEGRQWEGEEEEEDENENGNEEVEGQQLAQHAQRQHRRHQSVPRTLVYDVESGSLRFPKSRRTAATSINTATTTTHKVLQLKAPPPPHSKSVKGEQQGNNHFLKLHSESCSGRKEAKKKNSFSFCYPLLFSPTLSSLLQTLQVNVCLSLSLSLSRSFSLGLSFGSLTKARVIRIAEEWEFGGKEIAAFPLTASFSYMTLRVCGILYVPNVEFWARTCSVGYVESEWSSGGSESMRNKPIRSIALDDVLLQILYEPLRL